MAGLQSGEGRMMIDSVVWAQNINVTDTQTAHEIYKIKIRYCHAKHEIQQYTLKLLYVSYINLYSPNIR